MTHEQIKRYYDLTGEDNYDGAMGLIAPIHEHNPKDTLAMAFLGELLCRQQDFHTAYDFYTTAMQTNLNEGDNEVNQDFLLTLACKGRATCLTTVGNYDKAYEALELCLISERESGFLVIDEDYIKRFLRTALQAGGFSYAEESAKKMLNLLKIDQIRTQSERERLAAVIYANLAWLCHIEEKDSNGLSHLIDESPAGVEKCRRYCGIAGSYIELKYGDGAIDPNDGREIVLRMMFPWRIINGSRDLKPVQVNANHMVNEILTCGMFDFI